MIDPFRGITEAKVLADIEMRCATYKAAYARAVEEAAAVASEGHPTWGPMIAENIRKLALAKGS